MRTQNLRSRRSRHPLAQATRRWQKSNAKNLLKCLIANCSTQASADPLLCQRKTTILAAHGKTKKQKSVREAKTHAIVDGSADNGEEMIRINNQA
jgi:hypothetical protein